MKRMANEHLKLLQSTPEQAERARPVQVTMFPAHGPAILCIVHMPTVSGERFADTVRALRPAQVFDFRSVPTFSSGRLNRTGAFRLFEDAGSYYYDVPALVGVSTRTEAKLNGKAMWDAVVRAVRGRAGQAPIMLLLDDADAVSSAASSLPRVLTGEGGGTAWNVQVER